MTKAADTDDGDKICHGSPISLRLPKEYDRRTRELAKAQGRPLSNFVRFGFMQWLDQLEAKGSAPRARGGR